MRILLTSILCHSGLMTHVLDLINYLIQQEIYVGAAFKNIGYLTATEEKKLLKQLTAIPYYQYDTASELEHFVKQHNFNLIHAHSYATFKSAAEVVMNLDLPLVVTLHSVYAWNYRFRWPLKTARKIIAVGMAQAYAANRYWQKLTVIENGIDLTRFVPNYALIEKDATPDQINLLWYGRVDGSLAQGIRVLDEIAPHLPANWQMRVLGNPGIPIRNIPVLGWTHNPVPYLQQSHITFAHSRALREAMACGSVGILIGDGYGGVITADYFQQNQYPVMDAFPQYRLPRIKPQKIIDDLCSIISGDLVRMRHEARAVAEQYFDLNLMGERILKVYKEVI